MRLVSLDAVRGFDMFFIMGGEGLVCALAGWVLSFVFPINKALWSPSFTLVVGGYSFALFALFYWVIAVCWLFLLFLHKKDIHLKV